MKISKKEILNYLKYVLIMGIIMDSASIPSALSDKKFPSLKLLFAAFIISGPSLGYVAYKIHKNKDKIQDDISFRQYIIFKTTFEGLFILVPLWWLMKVLKFI